MTSIITTTTDIKIRRKRKRRRVDGFTTYHVPMISFSLLGLVVVPVFTMFTILLMRLLLILLFLFLLVFMSVVVVMMLIIKTTLLLQQRRGRTCLPVFRARAAQLDDQLGNQDWRLLRIILRTAALPMFVFVLLVFLFVLSHHQTTPLQLLRSVIK